MVILRILSAVLVEPVLLLGDTNSVLDMKEMPNTDPMTPTWVYPKMRKPSLKFWVRLVIHQDDDRKVAFGSTYSNHPLNRGFDFFYGHLGGGHRYFPRN